MSTQGEPWSKFYWADWRGDPKLRMCGLAARGLWMEMLSIMHEATPYGHLLVNGRAPSDQQIAVMVGASVAEVRRLKTELAAAGVPTIEDGIWTSRRMVKDSRRREVNRQNGRGGGNPKLMDKGQHENRITEPDNLSSIQTDNHADKSRATRDPEARSQKPERETRAQTTAVNGFGNRAKPLAEDFRMPPDWLTAAAEKRQQSGLPAANLLLEAEQFIAHQRKTAATSFDWRHGWISWALRAKPATETTPAPRRKEFGPL